MTQNRQKPKNNNEPRGKNLPTTGSNATKNRQKPPLKLTMNPEAESPTTKGSNAIKQAETPLKTNNEPRGRIRQQRREQCYKTGRNRHLKLTMNPEAESANNEGSNATKQAETAI
jgi:hypothetical protein